MKATGTMGNPVACAAKITPSLATRRGPVGPSGVKTMFLPLRARRIISRRALDPPRVDDPRAHSTPYLSKTPAERSPSFDRDDITMMGCRKREWSISARCSCQKVWMY
ncbi:MAG: hypothetical protein ABIP63_05640 [Thermoanaerobaculia bacterium]